MTALSVVGALAGLSGFVVGCVMYQWSKKRGIDHENARLRPRIQKWERQLSTMLGQVPIDRWPGHLSLLRVDLRDALGLPAYDGKPSEQNKLH